MSKFEPSHAPEMTTFFPDGKAMIVRYSPLSGKFNKVTLKLTKEQYNNWKMGHKLIQDAMPHLDKEEREFLMTGYTPEDWEKMFPPEDE